MSVVLKKEKIATSDVVCQKYSQTTAECDVIVPDINPDILTVLDVSGFVSVSEKVIRGNRAYIQGNVHMTMLYVPEGEVMNAVKSLSATQEFNHTVDIGTNESDLILSAEVEPESFSHTLINSRKVSLRAGLGIGVKVSRQNSLEVSTDVINENICTERKKIRLCNTTVSGENRIVLCEQLEMPSGKPTIGEILKTTATPESLEFSLLENKAQVKGQVRICNLYTSAEDGSVKFCEHTLPFSETIDILGAEEDMEGEIEYSISDIYSEPRDDSDGEPTIFGVEIGICATVRGFKIQEMDIISDAYSLKGTADIKSENNEIEVLLDNTTAQLTDKSTITLPEHLPPISQVCDINSVASVESLSIENGEIILHGKILSSVLYLTADQDIPVGSFKASSDFTHTLPAPFADNDTICDAKVYIEHTSYTLSGDRSIDLRTVLGLSVRTFKKEDIASISDIEINEDAVSAISPAIVIYFVKKGDSLWKIAKRFRTTVDALRECNNIEGDLIYPGQPIRICR